MDTTTLLVIVLVVILLGGGRLGILSLEGLKAYGRRRKPRFAKGTQPLAFLQQYPEATGLALRSRRPAARYRELAAL